MNSNFVLLNKTYETIDYMMRVVINFPKKDIVLRQNMETNLYQLVEKLFFYNINDNNRIREKYLKEYLVHLGMLNFFTHQALMKKYVNYDQTEKIGKIFLNLRKIAYTLLKGVTIND